MQTSVVLYQLSTLQIVVQCCIDAMIATGGCICEIPTGFNDFSCESVYMWARLSNAGPSRSR
jgi:hypothetical protein